MDERPSWGFWIVGTALLAVLIGCNLLPLIVFLGGGKYIIGGAMFLAAFLYDWGVPLAGAMAGAGLILLFALLVNRRRGTMRRAALPPHAQKLLSDRRI